MVELVGVGFRGFGIGAREGGVDLLLDVRYAGD